MKFEIKFPDLEQANDFVDILKEENLRGVKVSQAEKEPEPGSLDVAEYMPLIMLAVKSGFATAVVSHVFSLLKGVLVDNKKTNSNERIEKERIESQERIEMAKIKSDERIENSKTETDKQNNENKAKFIEFTVECNEKNYTFKFTQNDEMQINEILEIVKDC